MDSVLLEVSLSTSLYGCLPTRNNVATILVCDDERYIVELLIEIVEDAGHTAVRAGDGREALALAQHYHPHLIISDVMMPYLDGYGLLAAVRAEPMLAHTMIVLISANFNHYALPSVPGARVMAKPLDLVMIDQMLAALP